MACITRVIGHNNSEGIMTAEELYTQFKRLSEEMINRYNDFPTDRHLINNLVNNLQFELQAIEME